MVGLASVVVAGCSSGSTPSRQTAPPTSSPTTVTSGPTTSIPTGRHGLDGLINVGDCEISLEINPAPEGGSREKRGDCAAPHQAEVTAVYDIYGQFSGNADGYPDPTQKKNIVLSKCPLPLFVYVGLIKPKDPRISDPNQMSAIAQRTVDAGIHFTGVVSSRPSWDGGLTRLLCFAVSIDNQALTRPLRNSLTS